MNKFAIILTFAALLSASCTGGGDAAAKTGEAADTFAERGAFSADSAYSFVAAQVAFGPRVPGTEAHRACGEWLAEKLRQFGADTVTVSGTDVRAWDGKTLPVRNILARYNPEAKARVLLVAHYDTRPWADQDSDRTLEPIDGANDGASGVGVLLEVARNLGLERPEIGVDILLTDVEDYGARDDANVDRSDLTWCLGTRQWVENMPYTAADMPRFGILLDMVGAPGAKFHREYFSMNSAPLPTARVWAMAAKLGLQDRFPMAAGGAVTDDHLPLIAAGIPTTDIIENANGTTGSFHPSWHTHADNMEAVDPASLAAAGRVTLNVVYNEKP